MSIPSLDCGRRARSALAGLYSAVPGAPPTSNAEPEVQSASWIGLFVCLLACVLRSASCVCVLGYLLVCQHTSACLRPSATAALLSTGQQVIRWLAQKQSRHSIPWCFPNFPGPVSPACQSSCPVTAINCPASRLFHPDFPPPVSYSLAPPPLNHTSFTAITI